jgi:hypothetical protein
LKPILALLLFFCSVACFAQLGGSPEKTALKNIEKHRWQKAESRLRKGLEKDTLNSSLRYGLSIFYFHADNPAYHLDSAYHYAVTALDDYNLSSGRERERVKRFGVDSLTLTAFRARIDSAAFEVAREANTEAAYLEFLSHFPTAMQRDMAAQLRDEVAFQDALQQNTHKAFYEFLNRYPDAQRAPEARARYHRLLYLEETNDQRLTSFEKFLHDHPETPYRSEIYRNIFEISTADGSVESFLSYMSRYPVNDQVKKARQIIFHILAEEEEPQWPPQFLNDSLQHLLRINKTYLVPFLKNNLYGFMDHEGREVIGAVYENIYPDYLCGHIIDEILIADNQLVTRNGTPIFRGSVTDISDLGTGFVKINTPEGFKVIHKSGFVFADTVEDARVLGRSYLALKKNNRWSLHTLAGRRLGETAWQDIASIEDVVVFTQDGRKFVAPKNELGRSAEGSPLPLSQPLDEVKSWPHGLIWGRAGEFQGVLNQSLGGVIGFEKQTLTQTFFGALAATQRGFVLYNWNGKRSSLFDQVNVLGRHVGVKKNGRWFLLDPQTLDMIGKGYDSLKAEGAFILGLRSDSVDIQFADNHFQSFVHIQKISFIPGLDSTSFLIVQAAGAEKTVFDLKGVKLFSGVFDGLEYAGKGIFVIAKREKKGLVNIEGTNLLPPEFDAIGSVKDHVISILKNKKFGAYHIDSEKFIKPQYDRNLLPYTPSFLITFKDGYYGFLGWDNKPLSAFEFDEVTYWNDSLALVRKGTQWSLFDLAFRRVTETNLQSIHPVRDTPDEKIAIVQKENNFGVISNRGRVIIPLTFSAIINVGSAEAPLYFTEKHIPEASLYIVIYYDASGEMLRKEIYDDAGDYDRIYCSDQ